MTQSLEQLLQHLETLDHGRRMSHMVMVGRQATVDPGIGAMLRELASGSTYQRRLALQACHGSRDGEHVLRALTDPSGIVVGLATKLMPIICDDSQVHAALQAAAPTRRLPLFVRLVHRGRRAAIDDVVDGVLASGADFDLARLLPFASAACVARHMGRFTDAADVTAWSRLARQHPDFAAAAIEKRATAVEQLDARLVSHASAVLSALADIRPDSALRLVQLLARHVPLQRLDLSILVGRRPDALADLLLSTDNSARVTFEAVVRQLHPHRLRSLIERRPDKLGVLQTWLRKLPPDRRSELFDAYGRGLRDADGAIDPTVIALLPREIREREARRHLTLPALLPRPARRLPYTSFLPWDEMVAALKASVGSPDPELRATATTAYVGGARFHADRLADLITFVLARRNEQDPIRLAAMRGLASLPPGRWREENLNGLGQIIRQTLDAADLSAATAAEAERLAVNLLPFHPAWSAQWVATLVRERGRVSLYGLENRLTDSDIRRVAPALMPVFESWETRERRPQLVAAAMSLGRRLRAFDGLADILENVLYEPGDSWVAAQALGVLKAQYPERIGRLVPALLARDPSWATQPVVYEHLHHRAQSLLTPYLGRRAYAGRFSTGRTRFVLPIKSGFFRWTPIQQATFAKTLQELTRDAERDTPAVLLAVNQLSAMPDVAPNYLVVLSDAGNKKLAVRDAALRALGRLDAGRGVSTLLEALQDERARIAIYALRTALLALPPAGALALLRNVPTDKVTVAKEVVRLLGELRTVEAYGELMAIGNRGAGMHRDVRVAWLRALWDFLDQPDTWTRLYEAAADSDPDVASGVVRVPADRLDTHGNRRLAVLLTKLLEHPNAKLRLDVLQRIAELPVSDADRAMMPGLFRAMGSAVPDESRAAATAVFATYAGREAPHVGEAVARLMSNRLAVRTATAALEASVLWNRSQLLPTARAVLAALAADPLTASIRAGLVVRALPATELVAALEIMAVAGELHADAVASAISATDTMVMWLEESQRDAVAEILSKHADDRIRRVGLAALTAAARSARGWTDERLVRLNALQKDVSPLVAGAAQFTFPNVNPG